MTRGVFRCLTPARQQRQPPERRGPAASRGHMHPPAAPGAGRDGGNAEGIPLTPGPGERQSPRPGR